MRRYVSWMHAWLGWDEVAIKGQCAVVAIGDIVLGVLWRAVNLVTMPFVCCRWLVSNHLYIGRASDVTTVGDFRYRYRERCRSICVTILTHRLVHQMELITPDAVQTNERRDTKTRLNLATSMRDTVWLTNKRSALRDLICWFCPWNGLQHAAILRHIYFHDE